MTQPGLPELPVTLTGGRVASLADFKGKKLILYFYPKDNTPGCTTEGIDFAALADQFAGAGAVILGVSRDSVKSHEGFKAKHCFPFELISDANEELCNLFGVIKMKSMYGKQVRGIERSTFVFDASGMLVREWRGVKVAGHAKEVLDVVSAL